MHRALATFPQDRLTEQIGRNDLESEVFKIGLPIILPYLNGDQALSFQTMMATLSKPMKDAFMGLPEQLIHRDCHIGNLLSCGTEVTGIIDWDHLSLGPRILDLAYFAVQIAKRQIHEPDKMTQWLDEMPLVLQGYDQITPLLDQEKAALPYVMIAVPIFFTYWLIETGQFDSVQIELDAAAWLYRNLDLIRTGL
jgi:Ser/Thr protein kinase RdoA (MazF antagonist)